jgi:hypothetical protein
VAKNTTDNFKKNFFSLGAVRYALCELTLSGVRRFPSGFASFFSSWPGKELGPEAAQGS